jgi:RimJ/RimL family protein N-acetyltransferase
MLDPICLQNEQVLVHAFRPEELERYEHLVKETYQILSDKETLRFIPEKRLRSLADTEIWLKNNILNFHCGRNFLHFITERKSGKLLGMVDIISPALAGEHYQLDHYPHFIEFYLKSDARGQKIMTNLLPFIMAALNSKGIFDVGAVVNKIHFAARKVLLHSGFKHQSSFDTKQDLYYYTAFAEDNRLRRAG